jgi:hypothetical protein
MLPAQFKWDLSMSAHAMNEGKVGLSRAYFLLVPPTQWLRSSWQNQNYVVQLMHLWLQTNHQNNMEIGIP